MNYKVVSGAVLSLVLVLLTILLVLFIPRTAKFRKTFKRKCEEFPGTDRKRCEDMLRTFEEAYVGKSPCSFSEQNYDRFLNKNPFDHISNKTMLWSGTKGLVHDFSKRKDCFLTLEDTLVGSILDEMCWCGLKGCNQTFDVFCKIDTNKNPVISFWRSVSARFAAYASGVVTAMLRGDGGDPYDVNSFFAIEVKSLQYPRVTKLDVVLVTREKNPKKCDNKSLKTLEDEVRSKGIDYNCKTVLRSRILQCTEENIGCKACWENV